LAESLQSNHSLLTRAVALMVEHAAELFRFPPGLAVDVGMYMRNQERWLKQAAGALPLDEPREDLLIR